MNILRALLVGLAFTLGSAALAKSPKIGQAAPDFKGKTFDGRVVTLADLKGKVVIINFWATWCGPCKRELPMLDGYYRLRKDYGLEILAVDVEDNISSSSLQSIQTVVSFPMLKSLHGPYELLGGLPTNYIIGRDGVLRYAKANAFDLDDLNTLLVPLLNER